MNNKMLPLGSVVKLKDRDNMINIIGYFHTSYENNNLSVNEYTGIDYVEGVKKDSELFYFDETEIENVWFMGYMNKGTKAILEVLYEVYQEISTNNQTLVEAFNKIGNKYYQDNKEEFNKLKEKYFNENDDNKSGVNE